MTTKELIEALRDENNCNVLDCIDEAAQRLEELSAKLEEECYRHDRYVDFELAEAAELAKVKAERDAAIADIKKAWLCAVCKKRVVGFEWAYCPDQKIITPEHDSLTCDNFEWRGVITDE